MSNLPGVTFTKHFASPGLVSLASAHAALKTSSLPADEVSVMVPLGTSADPAAPVSSTVTVTWLPWLTSTEVGLSETLVVVGRRVTVSELFPLLVA